MPPSLCTRHASCYCATFRCVHLLLFCSLDYSLVRFFALKHGNRIFFETGTSGLPLVWNPDPELWARWRDGRTGLPLVDANMRELAATGGLTHVLPG